jgi:hypothetical protein
MQNESSLRKNRVSGVIVKTLAFALLLLVILWVRVFYGSMQDYGRGETLLKENQIIRAITYFDRSLHWYAPLNPYVQKSAQRLWEIGDRAERDGDLKLAFIAFSTIRSGFYGSSHFVVPGKQWIERSESRIRSLTRLDEKGKLLPDQKVNPPDVFWTVVLEIGLLGWIGAAFVLIFLWAGGAKEPRPRYGSPLLWLIAAAACFSLWIMGMFKA